ncbi:cinnamyl-alcohol dehydrogenase [Xylogone sp. PMI_703]|nr:cinnamyl-alcohol dehydrogenase [Xylogone sp. PMI_703]
MAGELILITGVSGFIGFRTLVEALATGYRVRATVRKSSQVESIRTAKPIQPYLKNLELVIVPDILAPGAFDESLKGAVYVLHIASPLAIPSENPQADIIDPAVNGTTAILSGATKTSTVKRVVITSSALVVLPFGKETERPVTENDVNPRPSPPWGSFIEAYINSKVLAYYVTQDWITEKKPAFDVISLMPSFVLGANRLITDVKGINSGTNAQPLTPLLGQTSPIPLPANSVHVDDVALAHIRALNPKVSGNQSFLLSSNIEGIVWDDAIEITRRNFPIIAEKGIMPLNGSQPTVKCQVDASKAEKQLGIKFQSYEEQVKSLVGYYLELSGEV